MMRTRNRTIKRAGSAFIAVATAVALLAFAPARADALAGPLGALAPASGALFGGYVDPDNQWIDNQSAMNEVTSFEAQIGRQLDIDQHYYSWTNTFPSGLEQWDLANGRTPLITWMATNLDTINSGSEDSMIRTRAAAVAELGRPVFLRWGHEMNGNWYSWSGIQNNDAGQTNGPEKFVQAWRHIHQLFDQEGATNVVWVWAPNHESQPNQAWNSWKNYYPGDDDVDWVAIDGYNWGTTQSWSKWTSFENLFSPVYDDYAASKPIMIAEVGSADQGGDKAAWITAAANAMKTSFPAIAALVWFDVAKEEDWRPGSSSGALQAFAAVGADPYFQGSGVSIIDPPTESAIQLTEVSAAPSVLVDATKVAFSINRGASISVTITRIGGALTRNLRANLSLDAGAHYARWHGHNEAGRRVSRGTYLVIVDAVDSTGNHAQVTSSVTVA